MLYILKGETPEKKKCDWQGTNATTSEVTGYNQAIDDITSRLEKVEIGKKDIETIILNEFTKAGKLDTQEVIREVAVHGLSDVEKWDNKEAGFFDVNEYAKLTAQAVLELLKGEKGEKGEK